MQDYKIRIPNTDISRQVQEKAFELGYKWASGDIEIRYLNEETTFYPRFIELVNNRMYIPSGNNTLLTIPEISYQDFLRLGEPTINNTTTQIMSEVTLKCIRQPQRARNITVDREYTGILIDSEDTQVDSWEEAEFFQCVNNNGLEAKYKLSLFEEPAAPAVPKITMEQLIERLTFSGTSIVLPHNNEQHEILNDALDSLAADDVNCSCGIKSINGLNDLWYYLDDPDYYSNLEILMNSICEDYDWDKLSNALFKMTVVRKIDELSVAMVLFSTTDKREVMCAIMDELCHDRNGWDTDYLTNPNSSNEIKAWLIPKL